MISLTIGTGMYLHIQQSNNLKEFIGLMIFVWSYYILTKAPPKDAVRYVCPSMNE